MRWLLNRSPLMYRAVMRFAHKYDWHYAPPCYPDGDTLRWCQWCGLRAITERANRKDDIIKKAGNR